MSRIVLFSVGSSLACGALVIAACSSSTPSTPSSSTPTANDGDSSAAGSFDGSTTSATDDGSTTTANQDGGTTGPGPILGGLQFPLDTIPTTVTTPLGGSGKVPCAIKSMQYTWALDVDGGLDLNPTHEYTFWDRSTAPQPGDGAGHPVYWTPKNNPKSLMCVERDSGTSNAYTLFMYLGMGEQTPKAYPGQEAICAWELIPHPDKNDKRFALRSGMTVPGGGKASYLGSLHAGGAQSRQTIVVGPTDIITPTNVNLVPWFTLETIAQVTVAP